MKCSVVVTNCERRVTTLRHFASFKNAVRFAHELCDQRITSTVVDVIVDGRRLISLSTDGRENALRLGRELEALIDVNTNAGREKRKERGRLLRSRRRLKYLNDE